VHHVRVGLQVGVGLHQREQSPHGTGQRALGPAQVLHRLGVARVAGRLFETLLRLVARLNDRVQGLPLVLHVALGGLHQVGDQVVASLELNLDL
jgi:hypothetical protein